MERASLDCWNLLPTGRLLAARERAAAVGALAGAAHLDNLLAWTARDRWLPNDVDIAAERCALLAGKLHLDVLHGMALGASAAAASVGWGLSAVPAWPIGWSLVLHIYTSPSLG